MSDFYSGNTALLLHMEGANNSTAFTDSSNLLKTVTPSGDAKISTAQSKWGSGSGYFDGTGDFLTVNENAFDLGVISTSTHMTLDLWVYPTSITGDAALIAHAAPGSGGNGVGGWRLYQANGILYFEISKNKNYPSPWFFHLYTNSAVLSPNVWTLISVVMSNGGVPKIYINGTETATTVGQSSGIFATTPLGFDTANTGYGLRIGATFTDSVNPYPIQFYSGYLQDVRFTYGIARYTANFTPPTARFPDPSLASTLILPSGIRDDFNDGGAYQITGTVSELGVPGRYCVGLFDRQSARCIRKMISAADGSYAFTGLAYRPQGYFAVGFDHGDNPLNAAIADLITPEPMP